LVLACSSALDDCAGDPLVAAEAHEAGAFGDGVGGFVG
jgi:hypothetical protein